MALRSRWSSPVAAATGLALTCSVALAGTIEVATAPTAGAVATTCLGAAATIVGTAGDDDIRGTSGNDVIVAASGNDVVAGLGGNDKICGGSGNDILEGGPGADTLSGGTGAFDLASYLRAPRGVTADLASRSASGDGNDELGSIEGLAGSAHDDHLLGDGRTNFLVGAPGDDLLDGRGGTNFVGFLTVDPAGVHANLTMGVATGQGTDTMVKIRGLLGTDNADTLIGGPTADVLAGGAGNDDLRGGGGDDLLVGDAGRDDMSGGGGTDMISPGAGDDSVRGGAQIDTVAFADSPSGVIVNLATGSAHGDGADALAGIESVMGSNFADAINGNSLDNHLEGLGGDDTITAGPGTDVLQGGPGADTMRAGSSTDVCSDGETRSGCEIISSTAPPAAASTMSSTVSPLASLTRRLIAPPGPDAPASAPPSLHAQAVFAPDYAPVYCPYELDSRLYVGPGRLAPEPGPGERLWYRSVVFSRTLTGSDTWSDNPAETYWFFRDYDSGNNFGYDFLIPWYNLTNRDTSDRVALIPDRGYAYAFAEQWILTDPTDSRIVFASTPYRWDNDVFYYGAIDPQNQVLACTVP